MSVHIGSEEAHINHSSFERTVPTDCAPLRAVKVPEKGAVLQDGKLDDNVLPD